MARFSPSPPTLARSHTLVRVCFWQKFSLAETIFSHSARFKTKSEKNLETKLFTINNSREVGVTWTFNLLFSLFFYCHPLATSVSVSAWTLVAISVERYYAICHPLRSRRWQTLKHAYKLIILVWLSSLLFMLPIAALSKLIPTKEGEFGFTFKKQKFSHLSSPKVTTSVASSGPTRRLSTRKSSISSSICTYWCYRCLCY